MKILDVRGLSCPEPVIKTKKALNNFSESFKVLIDQEVAKENVTRLIKNSGYEFSVEKKDQEYEIIVNEG